MKFHFLNLKRFLPLWYLSGFSILLLASLFWRAKYTIPRPLAVAGASLVLLIFQYSFFDHSLRHLLVLLPILAWELAPWTGETALDLLESGAEWIGPQDDPLMLISQPLENMAPVEILALPEALAAQSRSLSERPWFPDRAFPGLRPCGTFRRLRRGLRP